MSKISLDPKTEKRLINESKKNKEAFGKLYSHYNKHIFRYVHIKVSSKKAAEDITSTVFQKALEGIQNFKWQGVSFSSWLYKIARHSVIDYYRSQNKESGKVPIKSTVLRSQEKTPEEAAEYCEFEEIIEQILSDLPEREKKIVYMKFFEGYTNKTIAELLSITETNVGTILHRTIKKLRKILVSKNYS